MLSSSIKTSNKLRKEILADLTFYPMKLRKKYLHELAYLIEQSRIESTKLERGIDKSEVKSPKSIQKEMVSKIEEVRQFLTNRGFEIYVKSSSPLLARHKIGLYLVIDFWNAGENRGTRPLTLKPISALKAYVDDKLGRRRIIALNMHIRPKSNAKSLEKSNGRMVFNEGTLTDHGWHAYLAKQERRQALQLAIDKHGVRQILGALTSTLHLHTEYFDEIDEDIMWVRENYEGRYYLTTDEEIAAMDRLKLRVAQLLRNDSNWRSEILKNCRYFLIE